MALFLATPLALASSVDITQLNDAELHEYYAEVRQEILRRNLEDAEGKSLHVLETFLFMMQQNGHPVECPRSISNKMAIIYDSEVAPGDFTLFVGGAFELMFSAETPLEYIRECSITLMRAVCTVENTDTFISRTSPEWYYDKNFGNIVPGSDIIDLHDEARYTVSMSLSDDGDWYFFCIY